MPNSVLRTNLESVRPSLSTEILLLEFSLTCSDFLIWYRIHYVGWQTYCTYTPAGIGLESGTDIIYTSPVRHGKALSCFQSPVSSFCLDCNLYGVGHKNPGMPPCSLNPYRSVQCCI